jgi:hypothetical protein
METYMVRSILFCCALAASALPDSTAVADVCPDACRVAATDGARTKGVLARRRAARASRTATAAKSFPVHPPELDLPTQSNATAVLDATPSEAPYLPREETEVWPQARALFPAE